MKAAPASGKERRVLRCRRKFRRFFPDGFRDETYLDWERDYKWKAHLSWCADLGAAEFRRLLEDEMHGEIAARAVRIESRTNLLFSFEKMAFRDAVRTEKGARNFAEGLYAFLHGRGGMGNRFDQWCAVLDGLPRPQTRVLTWPVATVFGFLAKPEKHFFLKPNVTRRAAEEYGLEFHYRSRPNGETYEHLLGLAAIVRSDLADLEPEDMIDIQSFLWVQGSNEYEE